MSEINSIDLNERIAAAKSNIANNHPEKSLDDLKKIITDIPGHAEAYELAIQALRKLGDMNAALAFAAMGCMAIQDRKRNFLHLAYLIFEINQQWGMALSASEDLLRNYQATPDHRGKEINALLHLNELKRAQKKIFELMDRFPKDATSYRYAVQLYVKKGNRQKVKLYRKKLAKKIGGHWQYYLDHAESLIEFGKKQKARRMINACFRDQSSIEVVAKPPTVMQYFTTRSNQNQDVRDQLNRANLQLKYQWNAWLNRSDHYKLVGKEEATELIQTWFGTKMRNVFLKCGPAAMQADVFRVAFLAYQKHSLYLDWPLAPIPIDRHQGLLQSSKSILCKRMRGGKLGLWNGFAFNNERSCLNHLFQDVLERIFYNIENETANDVWHVTGPMTWIQAITNNPSTKEKVVFKQYQSEEFNMFYPVIAKSSTQTTHWSMIQQNQSIFV